MHTILWWPLISQFWESSFNDWNGVYLTSINQQTICCECRRRVSFNSSKELWANGLTSRRHGEGRVWEEVSTSKDQTGADRSFSERWAALLWIFVLVTLCWKIHTLGMLRSPIPTHQIFIRKFCGPFIKQESRFYLRRLNARRGVRISAFLIHLRGLPATHKPNICWYFLPAGS